VFLFVSFVSFCEFLFRSTDEKTHPAPCRH